MCSKRPNEWIDSNITGCKYESENMQVAPFMAGSLRQIILSEDFSEVPKLIRRKLMHLSFLMHVLCRFDNFKELYEHHCQVLDDIYFQKTTWLADSYFDEVEGHFLCNLLKNEGDIEDVDTVNGDVKVKVEQDNPEDIAVSNEATDYYEDTFFLDDCNDSSLELPVDEDNDYIEQEKKLKKKEGAGILCPYCDKKFGSTKWLFKHFNKKHPNQSKTVLPCKKCNKVFDDTDFKKCLRDYQKHYKNHTEDIASKKEVFCNDCNATIKIDSGASLAKHKHNFHTPKFPCPFCKNIVISEKWLLAHLKKHHIKEKNASVLCSVCGHVSQDFKEYCQHIGSHQTHTCNACDKTFKTKDQLNAHTRYAHKNGPNEPRESEMCPHCGKKYKFLPFHIYKSHSDRSFKCSACDYTSPLQCYVKAHFNNVHVGKTVACDQCGKVVKNVEEHKSRGCPMRKNITKYSCDKCDKTFSLKNGLNRHIKNLHMNIKDRVCPHCNYRTSEGFNLRIHIMRVHEGKHFKTTCQFCGKTVNSLNWHIKTYHVEEYVKLNNLPVTNNEMNVGICDSPEDSRSMKVETAEIMAPANVQEIGF